MRRAHLIFGIAALLAFIFTGQYMDKVYNHLRGMADLPRMLFRSRHIYILLASLLNLVLGTYLPRRAAGWRGALQVTGSIQIIIATCLLVDAFFSEPLRNNLQHTPLSSAGVYLIALGTVMHVIAGVSGKSL